MKLLPENVRVFKACAGGNAAGPAVLPHLAGFVGGYEAKRMLGGIDGRAMRVCELCMLEETAGPAVLPYLDVAGFVGGYEAKRMLGGIDGRTMRVCELCMLEETRQARRSCPTEWLLGGAIVFGDREPFRLAFGSAYLYTSSFMSVTVTIEETLLRRAESATDIHDWNVLVEKGLQVLCDAKPSAPQQFDFDRTLTAAAALPDLTEADFAELSKEVNAPLPPPW